MFPAAKFAQSKRAAVLLGLVVNLSVAHAGDPSFQFGQTQLEEIDSTTAVQAEAAASAQGEAAPFGLSWGMTKEDIERIGITLSLQEDRSRGAEYIATSLPKVIEGVKGVMLHLGFGGKLYRVTVVSKDYDNDGYGVEIRARYDELVKVLTQKYGAGKSHDYTSDDYRGDRWAYGLWKNENSHYTTFDTATVEIEISCRSRDMSDPYWVIIYDYKPGAEFEDKAKAEHEKNTL